MLKSKYTVLVCTIICLLTAAITVLFTAGSSRGIITPYVETPYAKKLFTLDRVHSLDIVVQDADWKQMLANALAEEYIPCAVVIDGEAVRNVGIRPKGNSSLVKAFEADTERYSFKIEFDHYVKGKTYYGLDKLALNNMAQDYTYLKDFLSFDMMARFGVETPLYSFIFIKVNGKDWGLYLAVEGIENAFAKRVYGAAFGKIYKPDTPGMQENQRGEGGGGGAPTGGGGPPTGDGKPSPVTLVYTDDNPANYREIFDHAIFKVSDADKARLLASLKKLNEGRDLDTVLNTEEILRYFAVHNFVLNWDSYTGMLMHNYYLHEENGVLSMIPWDYNLAFGAFDRGGGGRPAFRPEGVGVPAGQIASAPTGQSAPAPIGQSAPAADGRPQSAPTDERAPPPGSSPPAGSPPPGAPPPPPGSPPPGPPPAGAPPGSPPPPTGSPPTGSPPPPPPGSPPPGPPPPPGSPPPAGAPPPQGSPPPPPAGGRPEGGWGGTRTSAATWVNFPIDTPVFGATFETRPMLAWIFANEGYTEQYHSVMGEFIRSYFDSGLFEKTYDHVAALIAPYVEKDPTAFCTYEDFTAAQQTLKTFCLLRAESVTGQLAGTIGKTSGEQSANRNAGFVDASGLDIDRMGNSFVSFAARGKNGTD